MRPVRVLLAGGDRRFLRVADALLARGGCVTRATEKASDAPRMAARWRPDVAVLDVTGGPRAALRAAAALQALEHTVRVLVVAEERDSVRLGAQPKWDALNELVASIQDARSQQSTGEEAGVESR